MTKNLTAAPHGSLADRVKFAREQAGISQSELARRSGIKPQSIQAIESGRAKTTAYAIELARSLNVNPDWLRHGDPYPIGRPAQEDASSHTEILNLARAVADLAPDDLVRLKRVLLALGVDLSVPGSDELG